MTCLVTYYFGGDVLPRVDYEGDSRLTTYRYNTFLNGYITIWWFRATMTTSGVEKATEDGCDGKGERTLATHTSFISPDTSLPWSD